MIYKNFKLYFYNGVTVEKIHRENNYHCFMAILETLQYWACQKLAVNEDDKESILDQFLKSQVKSFPWTES